MFCLSVLRRTPTVLVQVRELTRVLSPGDWAGPRKAGPTKRYRGSLLCVIGSMPMVEGLVVQSGALRDFPITRRLPRGYDPVWSVRLGRLLSQAIAWNYRYHPTSAIQKVRPTGSFFVATKPHSSASVSVP